MAQNGKSTRIPKLNILYFAPCGLHEGVGGSARLKNMLDALEQLEANMQLLSYLPEEKFRVTRRRTSSYLNTTTVSVRRASPKFFKAFALVPLLIYGLRHIKKSDIIFAHAPGAMSGFPASILAKIFNKPLVIDHMDIKDPDTPKFIYNHVLKNSNVVFAISQYLANEVKEIGCRNAVYVPIFLNTDVFEKDALEGEKLRKKLGIGSNDIVIGYAGSFSHGEGVPLLLEAFQSLSKRYENIKLVIVGGKNVDGSDDVPQLINELALKERAIAIPLQPYELIPRYLSVFDIACSPKIDCEGNRAANPIKIYEYMSMGLPVVASAVGEISNVMENRVDGFLVKPGDANDLERTLEYIIQNLDSAKEAGRRAREKIIKRYTQQVISKTISDALKQLSSRTI
jgi:glycosyltransferase involved in cell wall biosynthesis